MKIILKNNFRFLLTFLLFSFFSCSAPSPRFEKSLGTICFVNLFEQGKEQYYDEIFARIHQIHSEFSIRTENSDLYRINHAKPNEKIIVSEDVFAVLETAQQISELTDGAFDISIAPVVSLWKITSDSPHIASDSELSELLPLVDFKNILLNREEKSIQLLKNGMKIDLGGIAKGFAADEIVKICKKHKIRRAVIDLGGNVYVFGKKRKGELWNVGVKNPEFPDSAPLLKITLPHNSVVTSGIYERYFEENETRYHHILSPQTGRPVENELSSVSVICTNSMLADALTTSFFVLGKEKSLKLIPKITENFGIEFSAIFVEKNHKITFSQNFPYNSEVLYKDWLIE